MNCSTCQDIKVLSILVCAVVCQSKAQRSMLKCLLLECNMEYSLLFLYFPFVGVPYWSVRHVLIDFIFMWYLLILLNFPVSFIYWFFEYLIPIILFLYYYRYLHTWFNIVTIFGINWLFIHQFRSSNGRHIVFYIFSCFLFLSLK